MVDSHLRQIQQLKEDLRVKNQEFDMIQRRQHDDEKDRALIEMKEKSRN